MDKIPTADASSPSRKAEYHHDLIESLRQDLSADNHLLKPVV